MAKKRRDRDRRPQQRRPASRRDHPSAEDQPLFQGLRHALRSGEPLDLLAAVGGIVEVTDPRRADPFARDVDRTTLADIVDSFIGTAYAETTAALTVIRALSTNDALIDLIDRELVDRRHPMPDWLAGLTDPQVVPDVWFLTHVLGDGDDYLFGVVLPSGHPLTALVYVDHNLGTVVKDAFVIPEPLEDVVLKLGTAIEQPDQSLTRVDAARARAVIDEAIDHGSRLYPPLESDSWPLCRPVVEWMLRHLPSGAEAPERMEWTDEETSAIAQEFFASPYGAPLDRADERDLLDSVLWFGTGYATGNPFNWSPVTVELLLDDWFPRKVVAEPAYLAKLPDLLRAFVRFCHHRQSIRAALTEETLDAVDRYEPDYQRTIRSSRLQGPAAIAAAMLGANRTGDLDDPSVGEIMLERYDRAVGGRSALLQLDDAPLPDEPFEWAGIPEDIHPTVREVLELCDRCADEILDIEHRTAMRRFLSRAAVGDPAVFRRRASTARAAGAIAWVIGRANDTVGGYGAGMPVQELLDHFGVKGPVSQRAEPLLRANGVDPHRLFGSMDLATPDLLTSERRADIIAGRDRWSEV